MYLELELGFNEEVKEDYASTFVLVQDTMMSILQKHKKLDDLYITKQHKYLMILIFNITLSPQHR